MIIIIIVVIYTMIIIVVVIYEVNHVASLNTTECISLYR